MTRIMDLERASRIFREREGHDIETVYAALGCALSYVKRDNLWRKLTSQEISEEEFLRRIREE